MTSRRYALKQSLLASMAWVGAAPAALGTIVQGPRRRAALVIGNQNYRHNPLWFAVNDARAMGDLLTQAGFAVDLRLNATRDQMSRAIDAFGRAATGSDVDTLVFYYAGHAAQLDWRNYLLPIDGNVEAAGDIRKQCIDLAVLLDALGRTKDKTALIILDSCRDDPFGPRFRPRQKGLSQYDAPAGTLLAFATAPGRVAIEVEGSTNAVYTGHLLRELSVKGVSIEDALKRVRLNVRVASGGLQVPWESTSLESEVFLFPPPPRSEAEIERELREEIEVWSRIKGSKRLDDWTAYLRRFPNGRFAEVAQLRMRGLLASAEAKKRRAAAARPAALRLGPTLPVPSRFQRSGNPNSAGTYPFQPVWTPGDEYELHEVDLYSGVVQNRYRIVVRRVDLANNRVDLSNASVLDLSGGVLKEGNRHRYDVPIQLNPAELQVGRKWTSHFQRTGISPGAGNYEFRITGREMIEVPAGKFFAFKIEAAGWLPGRLASGRRVELTRWVVPGINFAVRRENRQAGLATVLVSARQAVAS
jgi:uncharacterized caspase-like protein